MEQIKPPAHHIGFAYNEGVPLLADAKARAGEAA